MVVIRDKLSSSPMVLGEKSSTKQEVLVMWYWGQLCVHRQLSDSHEITRADLLLLQSGDVLGALGPFLRKKINC